MKVILLTLLFAVFLIAKDAKSCYTVQLLSVKNSKKNMKDIMKKDFPSSCKVMDLGRSIAVRCGCYNNMDKAEDKLYDLEERYRHASVTTTYRSRFKERRKKLKTEKSKGRETCFSVEIFKEKSRESIVGKEFPNNCQEMSIGKSVAVRCGCYKTRKEAKVEKYILDEEYKNTKVTTTYKYKFKDNKAKKSTKTCYSVEIFREKNTQENMGKLFTQEFPTGCVTLEIKDYLSVRCGCYDNKKDVIARYKKLRKSFKSLNFVNSYESRFKK
ncbi:MAG: hypothetical protein U9P38_07320 [Campylobacterota bacterium]|nr:hypothetical protein [Campylobacterota bacterium]